MAQENKYLGIAQKIFLSHHENICCVYSLELPLGNSNEYTQHTIILWKIKKTSLHYPHLSSDWLSWGVTTRQSLWVILCRLPEKGRKEIETIVEEMKETDREERGTGMKVKKQKK